LLVADIVFGRLFRHQINAARANGDVRLTDSVPSRNGTETISSNQELAMIEALYRGRCKPNVRGQTGRFLRKNSRADR